MQPFTAPLKKIIPAIFVLAGLIFIAVVYIQLGNNLKKELIKNSLNHVQQRMEFLQRTINNALSENNWERAEDELLAINYDEAIEQLFLIDKGGNIILANKTALKKTPFTDKQLQIFFSSGDLKPLVERVNEENIVAIYPVLSTLRMGEFHSQIFHALYFKYNIKSRMVHQQSVLYDNMLILFLIILFVLAGIAFAFYLLILHPIEVLTYFISHKKDHKTASNIDIIGKGEIALLADEFNKREQLIN